MKTTPRFLIAVAVMFMFLNIARANSFEDQFANPPDSARPWVYWFWSNGNVTKEGITADLEAMKRVGIGGVLIMDVVETYAPPVGPAEFMNAQWRDDFQFAVTEAARLGLEINMTNGPGWCGSSGPWITPELSMQKLVMTQTAIAGAQHFDGVLPRPDVSQKKPKDHLASFVSTGDFYQDVAVIGFPESADGKIPRDAVVDLSSKMDSTGKLSWDVPDGRWIVQRFGHASTGSSTRPPVLGGNGLECDKLNPDAMDVQFNNMMGKLLETVGPLAGKTLVATHIDSWEVGSQNWTSKLPEEFKKQWGYDLLPFLPDLNVDGPKPKAPATARSWQIDGKDMADRFRWDFYQTISDMMARNYTGHIAQLAHQHGLRFTLEGYSLPFGDEQTYTAAADEPMTEFWAVGNFAKRITESKAVQMASVAHVYGRPIVGAESFTSVETEQWKFHPATLKSQGDFQFSQGVNRFVIHRYAHQPWLDRQPGATMGPWGLHYERTNTWWEMSGPWHQYLARCQWMLRQGKYVADLLYLRPQYPNQQYFDPVPARPVGYRYDQISAEALIDRVTVKEGRLVLPDGMSYRMLVMPTITRVITPELAKKIRDLVEAGAIVYGPAPTHSPSLADYPNCDQEVAKVAADVWGDTPEHAFGKGKVFNGPPLEDVLAKLNLPPDFKADGQLNWIHRHLDDAEIYFVANPADTEITADCTFRVEGMRAELWNPETGECSSIGPDFHLHLGPSGSAFIVFRPPNVVSQKLVTPMGPTKLQTDLSEKWDVTFPPKWGAPATASLDKLISWSDSPDEGIRHFSGTAVYHKKFTIDKPAGRSLLNLGDVQVMAHVKLNGHDLGILWKQPYQLEVTDVLKAGENELEISVVNLWPNRMIGDAALPEDKRFTWSTWMPFKSDTPLLKSGLIGPVELRIAAQKKNISRTALARGPLGLRESSDVRTIRGLKPSGLERDVLLQHHQ